MDFKYSSAYNSNMMGRPETGLPYGSSFYDVGRNGLYGCNEKKLPISGSAYGWMGSVYNEMGGAGMDSMYRPVGSLYGPSSTFGPTAVRPVSSYGFTAQWSNLSNVEGGPMNGAGSMFGAFDGTGENDEVKMKDVCPVIMNMDDISEIKRSGRRGGNHLYTHDKKDKFVVMTTSLQSTVMAIKHRRVTNNVEGGAAGDKGATLTSASPRDVDVSRTNSHNMLGTCNKSRAKVPTTYDLHSLVVVDKTSTECSNRGGASVVVMDANTIHCENGDKKETF
uniref:Siroheme synthase n=1 Tax=Lygus hesperus TaxID=30085 RepID=A0A0A9YGU6_LYGHE